MKRILTFLSAVIALSCISSSCDDARKSLLPQVSGKEGEVLVVTNRGDWNGTLGGIIRDSLSQPYPYLLNPEPTFDVSFVPNSSFTDIFRTHRNIFIVNVDPKVTEPGVIYKHDQWAAPQCVIKLNAASSEEAADLFREKCSTIMTFIEQSARDCAIINNRKYEERSFVAQVKKMAGGAPNFPFGYSLKKGTDDFIWISQESQYVIQDVLIFKYPIVEGVDMMDPQNLKNDINEMLMKNVPGPIENSYMMITPGFEPYIGYKKYKDNHFAEIKGLWETYNEFMGGTFTAHAYYSPNGTEMVVIFGFVYTPKYDKRTYMRQLEAILYSFTWNKE